MTYEKKRSFRVSGDEKWDLEQAKVFGRQVIDTMLTSVKYDFKKDYPTFGLKPIIDYETKKADMENPKKRSPWQKALLKRQKNRQFYDASKIDELWSIPEEREKIKKYCLEDCFDALDLFDLQITPYFYYSQYLAMDLQEVIASATGAQIDGFLIRSYLQHGYSIPDTNKKEPVSGGISMGVPGVYRHVYKVDVASLYPSIILTEKLYCEKKDPNAHFLKMVKYFTEMRLDYKAKANQTGDSFYEDVQQAFKIV
ncbi:hypothetical protein, partial [Nocardia mangyaensis]|uniref:hypothetical protein n=1 Tax=Nocardia mangyaensis TaxID=2213200 RepID=UPI00267606FA